MASGSEDKRLETDLEDVRQVLWEDGNGDPIDYLQNDDQDKVRWIDTSTMVADPLTKGMSPERLVDFMTTGLLDLEATPESKIAKMMKQKQRAKVREEKQQSKDVDNSNQGPHKLMECLNSTDDRCDDAWFNGGSLWINSNDYSNDAVHSMD